MRLKDVCWPHGIRSQMEWINNNIKPNDIHVCVFDGDVIIGYCDLIDDFFAYKETNIPFYGIGNLCVDPEYRKKGIGSFLLKKCLSIGKKDNKSCLLLCKDENNYLYYLKNGCISFDKYNPRIIIGEEEKRVHLLLLNPTFEIKSFMTIVFGRNF